MSPTSDPVVRRLTTLVALQAVLLAIVAGAGLFFLRAYTQAKAAVPEAQLARLSQTLERVDDLAREVTYRQHALAKALDVRADQTLADLKKLRARRDALAANREGPFNLGTQLKMTELMGDMMLTMVDHIAWSQHGMAKAMQPLDEQKRLTGTGGSGERDDVEKKRPTSSPARP